MSRRPGRNDPCSCGSGLKYKYCHLDWDRRGIVPGTPPPELGEHGKLGGYRVIFGGEQPNPGRWQRWPVPGGFVETSNPLDVFEARVRPFSLDSIVSVVADLTRAYWKNRTEFNQSLEQLGFRPGTVFLPVLLRRLVTQVITARSLPDEATEVIDLESLAAAERVLIDIAGMRDHQIRESEISSLGMRVFHSQFHDQLNFDSYLRELWLNLRTINRCLAAGVDLETL